MTTRMCFFTLSPVTSQHHCDFYRHGNEGPMPSADPASLNRSPGGDKDEVEPTCRKGDFEHQCEKICDWSFSESARWTRVCEWKAIILKCDQLHGLCLPLPRLHPSCGGHMSELSGKLMVGNSLPDCSGRRHLEAILSEVSTFVPSLAL